MLQHRKGGRAVTPSTAASLGLYYILFNIKPEISVVQIVEDQLCSEKWGVLYPGDDVGTKSVDFFRRSAVLQVCLKKCLSDACSARQLVAKDMLLSSLRYYRLLTLFQAFAVEDLAKMFLRCIPQEIGF